VNARGAQEGTRARGQVQENENESDLVRTCESPVHDTHRQLTLAGRATGDPPPPPPAPSAERVLLALCMGN
jgi:hypothetical protein